MALTYSVDPPQLHGNQRVITGTITFDSSYATAGESFSPAAVGLTTLKALYVQPGLGSTTTAYVPAWDRSVSAAKVQVFWGDNNNASDAALIEVASTTDLSAFKCDFRAVGY